MTAERRPSPDCPYCHGTGFVTVNNPFLDRVDEATVVCRCMKKQREGEETGEEADSEPAPRKS